MTMERVRGIPSDDIAALDAAGIEDNDWIEAFNRNGALPARERGYYREFTVLTPGARDRGARRLVTGGCGQQVSTKPVRVRPCTANHPVYWTDDHYDTFRRVGR